MDLVYERRLVIDGDRVFCPYQAEDVDVERCWTCGWLRTVGEDGRTLRCVGPDGDSVRAARELGETPAV